SIGMTEALFITIFFPNYFKRNYWTLKWGLILIGYLGVTLVIIKSPILSEFN
ncbi:putative membrane protein, partial [Orientia tsutsugamushi str. Gilliam]